MSEPGRIDQIDALLPQTQCRRCGFPTCRDYATALAQGHTSINRCPPGGYQTIKALARYLKTQVRALDPECGAPGPVRLAIIDESWCVGCTVCLRVCPVDAIVGAAKQMHTVIARECTGCELCVQPCPTDCIEMLEVSRHPARAGVSSRWSLARAKFARERFQARQARVARLKEEHSVQVRRAGLRRTSRPAKQRAIEAAVARVRLNRAGERKE